ncbi:hypothetical protein M3Y94_01069200 [Aphelenchoides besseyi]|nr:hypothetical protein M3Y94_01069200 [Aphelenchoides besseyi]
MTLYVFPPFFDLPSLDPVSLQFLAVSRFVASDIRVVPTAKPSETPTGKLPCYVDNDVKISDFDEFVDYLRGAHREIVLDYELTQEQRSLCVAYSALVREKLVPALEHLFWIDEYNYGSLTRSMFTNTMGFPNYFFFLEFPPKCCQSTSRRSEEATKGFAQRCYEYFEFTFLKIGRIEVHSRQQTFIVGCTSLRLFGTTTQTSIGQRQTSIATQLSTQFVHLPGEHYEHLLAVE